MKIAQVINYLKKFEQGAELFFYDNDKEKFLALKSFEEEPMPKGVGDSVTINFED